MTTPTERYFDLMTDHDDLALVRLVDDLDRALHALPAPPHTSVAVRQALDQRMAAVPLRDMAQPVSKLLSRKEAIKASAVAAGAAWLLALGHTDIAIASEVVRLAGEGPMTAPRLTAIMRDERARWQALLARVGADRMEEPGVEGMWSVKQIVAHLTWYEGVIVEGARQIMNTGTFAREGLRAVSIDERNEILAAQSNARPLGDVFAESERVFAELLAVIAACPDDVLNDPLRLGLPDDVVPWALVANNSYAHYQQHAQAIRAWLDNDRQDGAELPTL